MTDTFQTFVTNAPYALNPEERDIRVTYVVFDGERRSADCPGHPGYVAVVDVEGDGYELAGEIRSALLSGEYLDELEREAEVEANAGEAVEAFSDWWNKGKS